MEMTIAQHSLHDELLSRLRSMIVSGQFQPGEKIPERQLCDQFGVSRTPLREALKVLAAEGLVQLAPNRGAMVAVLTPEGLEDCLPIAMAVEALAGRLACEAITDAEIEAVKDFHKRMRAEHEAGNVAAYLDLVHQATRAMVASTRNPLLTEICDTLFYRIGRNRLAPHISREEAREDLADQEQILKALEARQCDELAGLLKRRMERLSDIYRSALSATDIEAASTA
jgi:DNA-binding GntR family transcriptional regulator